MPYYLGWDRSGYTGTGGVGIHHPSGDIKKISTYTMAPQSTDYLNNTVNASGNHWRIIWAQTTHNGVTKHGVTEGGSSGSPLINNNRRVIGQLKGGYADCDNKVINGIQYGKNAPDWYGKFSVSWTGNGASDSRRRLSNWLAPGVNNPPMTLDGRSGFEISASTTLLCYGFSATFTVDNPPSGFIWDTSSNLDIIWTDDNEVEVEANTGSSSDIGELGWVNVKVNGTEVARKEVWVGPPSEIEISGPDYVSSYGRYTAVYNPLSAPHTFAWDINVEWPNQYPHTINRYGDYADFYFGTTATYPLTLDVCNACGCAPQAGKYVYAVNYSPSPVLSYPNPANDILFIEIDPQADNNARSSISVSYDIKLYNQYGIPVRNTTLRSSKEQFDISNLPNGMYFLHISDGINPEPEKRQIVIKH